MSFYYQSLVAALSQKSVPEPQVIFSANLSSSTGTAYIVPTAERAVYPLTAVGGNLDYGIPGSVLVHPAKTTARGKAEPGDLYWYGLDNQDYFRWRHYSNKYASPTNKPMQPRHSTSAPISFCGAVDDNGYLWVNDYGVSTTGLIRLDPQNPDSYTTFNIGSYGYWIIYDKPRRQILVSNNTRIVAVDIDSLSMTTSTGTAMASCQVFVYDENADRYYLLPAGSGTAMGELNPTTLVVTTRGNTVNNNFRCAAFDPVSNEIWAGAHFDSLMAVIDPVTGNRTTTVALGDRPCGALYEPEAKGRFGTVGKRIWVLDQGFTSAPATLHIIEPVSRSIEETVQPTTGTYTVTSAPIQLGYREAEYNTEPIRPVVLDDILYTQDTASLVGGLWVGGDHNDISGGYIDRIIDLSGNGNHLDLVGGSGTRAAHIAADPIFNDAPSMNFVAANSCHYRSTGSVYLSSIVGTGPGGSFAGDTFCWIVVFSYSSLPTPTGGGSILTNYAGLFGGVDGSNQGAGVFLYQSVSQGRAAGYMGNSPTTYYTNAAPVNNPATLNVPRAFSLWKKDLTTEPGHHQYFYQPAAFGSASYTTGPAAGGALLGKSTARIEVGSVGGSPYADVHIAAIIALKNRGERETWNLGINYLTYLYGNIT